jgi:hypothetical protein
MVKISKNNSEGINIEKDQATEQIVSDLNESIEILAEDDPHSANLIHDVIAEENEDEDHT